MKIRNVISGIASTLFVMLILTLGLSTEMASAHGNHNEPCTGPHKNDPDCDDGGGDDGGGGSNTNVPFAVGVIEHLGTSKASTLYAPTTVLSTCLAQASSIRHLWAGFPRHDVCSRLTTTTAAVIEDDVVVKVESDQNSGVLLEVISIQVTGQDTIGAEGLFHQSDVITNIDSFDINGDGSFLIHVHADAVTLWKCDSHLLRKKTNCVENVGMFAIHDMIYTPDP